MATLLKHTVAPSGGDYTTLAACIAHLVSAHPNFVTADVYGEIEISGTWSAADTTAVLLTGITLDATHYLDIYAIGDAKQTGLWRDTGAYTLAVAEWGGKCFNAASTGNFVRMHDIQLRRTSSGGESESGCIFYCYVGGSTADLRLYKCIIKGIISGTSVCTAVAIGGWEPSTTAFKEWDNIYIGWKNGVLTTTYAITNPDLKAEHYNITFKDCYTAIANGASGAAASSIAKNLLMSGCTDSVNITGTFAAGTDYNLTDSATAIGYTVTGGGNSHDQVNHAVSFVGAADFHLAAALGHGVSDPGAGLFSDDIDGVTRSGAWDNGADQYVTAETSTNIAQMIM